jgi:hypothetical protein
MIYAIGKRMTPAGNVMLPIENSFTAMMLETMRLVTKTATTT